MMQGQQKWSDCSGFSWTSFLKLKMKFHFYKKQVTYQSVSVIFGLARLIILDRKSISRGTKLSATHPYAYKVLYCANAK